MNSVMIFVFIAAISQPIHCQNYGWNARPLQAGDLHFGINVDCMDSHLNDSEQSRCYMVFNIKNGFGGFRSTSDSNTAVGYNSHLLIDTSPLVYRPSENEIENTVAHVNFIPNYYCKLSIIYIAEDMDTSTLVTFDRVARKYNCRFINDFEVDDNIGDSENSDSSGSDRVIITTIFIAVGLGILQLH